MPFLPPNQQRQSTEGKKGNYCKKGNFIQSTGLVKKSKLLILRKYVNKNDKIG